MILIKEESISIYDRLSLDWLQKIIADLSAKYENIHFELVHDWSGCCYSDDTPGINIEFYGDLKGSIDDKKAKKKQNKAISRKTSQISD